MLKLKLFCLILVINFLTTSGAEIYSKESSKESVESSTEVNSKEVTKESSKEEEIILDSDKSKNDEKNSEEESLKKEEKITEKVVVCYLNREAAYRPSLGLFDIDDIEPSLCTHLVYAFAKLDADGNLLAKDPSMDLPENHGHDGYRRITGLKGSNPHIKVLLGIGGWKNSSKDFSDLVSSDSSRKNFALKSAAFLKEYEFDGLDLNWHYPANRGGKPEDKENFVKLIVDLRKEFSQNGLLVTSSFEASKDIIDSAYDIENLSKNLDYMFITAYDMGGSWDRRVVAHASLSVPGGSKSIQFVIDYITFRGAEVNKIVLGLPFYGRTFISELSGDLGDAAFSEGFKGPYTDKNGYLGYNEICDALDHPSYNWTTEWYADASQMLAKYRDPLTNLTHAVVYDTQRSLANKVRFAIRKKLAGVMIWSIDTDDFKGDCQPDPDMYNEFGKYPGVELEKPAPPKGRYSLLKAVNQAIEVAEKELAMENKLKEEDNQVKNWDGSEENKPIIPKSAAGTTFVVTAILPVVLVHLFAL